MTRINNNQFCFMDTNIWLYAFIRYHEKHKNTIAKQIIQNQTVITSSQVINEVCVNMLRKTDFSEFDIQNLVLSFYKNYTVIELNQTILLKASELRERISFLSGMV